MAMTKAKKKTAKRKKLLRFGGFDLALNHTAYVEIDESGEITHVRFITGQARIAAAFPDEATLFSSTKLRGKTEKPDYKLRRLMFAAEWLETLISERMPDFASVEGYAYNKRNNTYEIGELGGQARRLLAQAGIPFQLVNVGEVKSYAGIRSSDKPIAACWEFFGHDWTEYAAGLKTLETVGDLADADMLAHMCRDEHRAKTVGYDPSMRPVIKKVAARPWLIER